jgi:hypothetical protein
MFMPTRVKKKSQTRKNRQLEKVWSKHWEGGGGGELLVLVEMGTWGSTTFDYFSNECGQFAPKTNQNVVSTILIWFP